jgi:hypothetical protein
MSSSEKRWVLIFGLLVMVVTSIPYLIGFWLQGSSWRFTGFLIGVGDGNSYLAKMLLGASGDWLFRTPYTAYPQNGFLAFLPYLLLGKLSSAPGQHEQLIVLFQVFRWIAGMSMILASYQFIAYFVVEPRYRKLGTALMTIGGGLGWLVLMGLQSVIWGEQIPLEFYSPETFGFLSIFSLPHLALARALLLWGLLIYWRSWKFQSTLKIKLLMGLVWLALGFMQPMTVLIGWMVLGLDLVIRIFMVWKLKLVLPIFWKNGILQATAIIGFSAPLVIYTAISFLTDPFLKIWSQQNIILSPPPVDYLFAYGVTLPFLFFGIRKLWRQKQPENFAILAWLLLLPVLAYFPYNLQRRMPEGIWCVLCVFSMLGLAQIKGIWKKVGNVFLYTSFLMAVVILSGSLITILQLKSPIYRPVDETNAFQYLASHASGFPVVLAAFDTANAMPAWAAVRTLIGHGPESIHLADVQPRVENFYRPNTQNSDRSQLIDDFNIRYIFWGPAEKELGQWNPATMPGLKLVYQNETCELFEVGNR